MVYIAGMSDTAPIPFNVMMSGIPGTNKTEFANALAAHSALMGIPMEVITFGAIRRKIRAIMGASHTSNDIWNEVARLADRAHTAGRLVAFEGLNLTAEERISALTMLRPSVPGPWAAFQIHADPEEAARNLISQKYKRGPSPKQRQFMLYQSRVFAASLEVATTDEGFEQVLHFDMHGNPLSVDDLPLRHG
jgi:hypothetical protein